MATQVKTMQVKSDVALAETTTKLTDTVTFDVSKLPNGITYKGLKAVLSFADPIGWNKDSTYDALTVVWDEATLASYASKRPVPSGIGITNELYWLRMADGDAQVEIYRQSVEECENDIATIRGEMVYGVKTAADIQNLDVAVGSVIVTSGFYTPNDGGGATYAVMEGNANGFDKIACKNGKIASLIGNEITLSSIGCKEGVEYDNAERIQYAIDNDYHIVIDKTYHIKNSIRPKNGSVITSESIDNGLVVTNGNVDAIVVERPNNVDWSPIVLDNFTISWEGVSTAVGVNIYQQNPDGYGIHNSFIRLKIVGAKTAFYNNGTMWNNNIDLKLSYITEQCITTGNGFGNDIKIQHLGKSANANHKECVNATGGGTFTLDIEDWDGVVFKTEQGAEHVYLPMVHIERCKVASLYGSFISIASTPAVIGMMSVYNCTFDYNGDVELILYTGNSTGARCSLLVMNVNTLNNTVNNANVCVIRPSGEKAECISIVNVSSNDNFTPFFEYPAETIKSNCFYRYQGAY